MCFSQDSGCAILGFPEGLAKSAVLGKPQVEHLFKTAAFLCLGFPPNKKTTRQRTKKDYLFILYFTSLIA
jgi:hypothetical protein